MTAVATAKNPSIKISAMRAMGAIQDMALAEETWDYVMKNSRDQDLFYFFGGFMGNPGMRHFLLKKFREDYQAVWNFPRSLIRTQTNHECSCTIGWPITSGFSI